MRSFKHVVSAAALCTSFMAAPGEALPPRDDDGDIDLGCLDDVTGSLAFSPSSVNLGQSSTLRYSASVPSNCTSVALSLNAERLSTRTGSRVVTPQSNVTYRLTARRGSATVYLAQASISVVLPQRVDITRSDQQGLLVQALGTPGTDVFVANNVDMDLSHRTGIRIAEGVSLFGQRSARVPGARLYTTTRPNPLFSVAGDNVRVSGVRIEGPDMGVSGSDEKGCAIRVRSHREVEIDHNELSGWSSSAVAVEDDEGRIDPILDQDSVHVHDNFIHHNQSEGRMGYGVVVGDGAYVLIERNVFDWNRHAIAGDGSDGSGYSAYRNLVLQHGGLHRWIPFPGFWVNTHQFDMHGQDNCGIGDIFSDALYNCGTAGHHMEIRNNAFLYTDDEAIKLRGTPQVSPYGMMVVNNVFAHGDLGDAVSQNESGLYLFGNQTGVNSWNERQSCDLDGDGTADSFLATGQTWWYASGGAGPWTYLHASTRRAQELELGFFDGDTTCDVRADGVVYPGGRPARLRPFPGLGDGFELAPSP
jgi:hypothetical protein